MTDYRRFKRVLREVPFLWDIYAYFWGSNRRAGYHRGLYHSYETALQVCHRTNPPGENPNGSGAAELAALEKVGRFDPRDYPLVMWLARAFEDSSTLFDLGGSVGLGYYAYRNLIRFPASLRWVVCEVPEMCQAGRSLAAERGRIDLEFTDQFSRADGMEILLSCGALQCIDLPFPQLLSTLNHRPKHVLLQRVPLASHPTYYTIQKSDADVFRPYRIENKEQLFRSISAQGYRLIDSWKDSKRIRIPFYPDRVVDGYYGAYFQLEK